MARSPAEEYQGCLAIAWHESVPDTDVVRRQAALLRLHEAFRERLRGNVGGWPGQN